MHQGERRDHVGRRRPRHPAGKRGAQKAAALRSGVPELQPLPAVHGPAERDAGRGAAGKGAPGLQGQQKGDPRPAGTAGARNCWRQMGLSERAGHYPHQLSGGQQQRVAIARALALHPDILCFDEPTSALDPELTGEVLRVLRDLADRKTTMIIVTHEMHFARDVADRILFMDGGVVVEEGPAKQLIDHPQRTAHQAVPCTLRGISKITNSLGKKIGNVDANQVL